MLIRQLAKDHAAQLFKLAARMVGRSGAEGVARDVFVRLARRIEQWPRPRVDELLRSPSALQRLIHQLTACRAYEVLRQRKGQGAAADRAPSERALEEAAHLAPRTHAIEAIERAYQGLPALQRIAHVLHHYGGLPDAELAATLGISPAFARSLVQRGTRALKRDGGDPAIGSQKDDSLELTSREQDLLAAWDRSNLPHELDEPCEQRLLAAHAEMADITLDELDADDRATLRRIADECTLETQRATAEFSAIARKHDAYLRSIAMRLCGDRETAKDLVQETLARALLHFDQFAQGSNARGWLVTILTRLYYDMFKHARVISRAEDDLMTLAALEFELELPRISDAELWAAVRELEPDLRVVVERCYVHEMSYKAIADELRVPVGTIGTRLRRARERLRELLGASDTGE